MLQLFTDPLSSWFASHYLFHQHFDNVFQTAGSSALSKCFSNFDNSEEKYYDYKYIIVLGDKYYGKERCTFPCHGHSMAVILPPHAPSNQRTTSGLEKAVRASFGKTGCAFFTCFQHWGR
eukprot:EG_transcript_43685